MSDKRFKHEILAGVACEGLTLPADVKPGAVKELVEAAQKIIAPGCPCPDCTDVLSALANLGIKESPR